MFRESLNRSLCVLTCASLVACGQEDASDDVATRLELVEFYSRPLTDGSAVSGVRVGSDMRVISWSEVDSYATLFSNDHLPVQLNSKNGSRVLLAEFTPARAVRLLIADSSGLASQSFDASGKAVSEWSKLLPVKITSAAKIGEVVFAGGADSLGTFQLFRFERSARPTLVLSIPAGHDGRDTAAVAAHLSQNLGSLEVSLLRFPYTIWSIDVAEPRVVATTRPIDDPRIERALGATYRAVWLALRGVPLDSGSLHVIADLASDRRVAFATDGLGRILLVKEFVAPLGFVDSRLPDKVLCAVRSLEKREVVCYRWTWTADSSSAAH